MNKFVFSPKILNNRIFIAMWDFKSCNFLTFHVPIQLETCAYFIKRQWMILSETWAHK